MQYEVIQKKQKQESQDIEKIIADYSKVTVLDPQDHVISQNMPRFNLSISKLKQNIMRKMRLRKTSTINKCKKKESNF